MRRRKVQRCGVVREVAAVEVGTALDQKTNGGVLIAQSGKVQRRGFQIAAPAERIDQLGVNVEAGAKCRHITALGGAEDVLDRARLLLRAATGSPLHITG